MADPVAEASVEIDAPLSLVWDVMTDLRRYHEWNPFIFQVDCDADRFAPGVGFLLHVRFRRGNTTTSREAVSGFDAPASIDGVERASLAYRFLGPLDRLNLVRGTRSQTLERAPGRPTVYRTREAFRGLLSSLVPLRDVQEGFERHAAALKVRAELLASGGGAG